MEAAPTPEAADADAAAGAAPADADDDLSWLAPQHRASPAQALRRIRVVCEQTDDLYGALLTVVATHQGLRHDMLASAVKRFRRDLDEFGLDDVTGLLRACWNGGWQGFDAVLRSRQGRSRKGAALATWMKPDS